MCQIYWVHYDHLALCQKYWVHCDHWVHCDQSWHCTRIPEHIMTIPGSVPVLMSTLWLHLVWVHCDYTWYEYIVTAPGMVAELVSTLWLPLALCQNYWMHCNCTLHCARISEYIVTYLGTVPETMSAFMTPPWNCPGVPGFGLELLREGRWLNAKYQDLTLYHYCLL